MVKLYYDQGHRYSPPHAFRMGDTEEIKNPGPTFAAIIKSGSWDASGYKSYLVIHADEAVNISKILLDDGNSGSNVADPDSMMAGQKLRREVTKLPLSTRRGKPPKRPESTDRSISEKSETSG